MGCTIKILLTGSSGFIGGRFFKDYQNKYDIVRVSLQTTSPSDIDFAGIDVVVHCAALVHQMEKGELHQYMKINRDLSLTLAQEAKKKGVKHFVYLSTAHVFGDSGTLFRHSLRVSPNSSCHPKNFYAQSKLAAEIELQKLKGNDFIVSIIRPPMVYGEGAKGNILALKKMVSLFPLLPLGYKKNQRSLIYVGNLSKFISYVIHRQKDDIYLPQDKCAISISDLCDIIARGASKKIYYNIPIPDIAVKIVALLTPELAKRLFGTLAFNESVANDHLLFSPPFTTQEGLNRMFGD